MKSKPTLPIVMGVHEPGWAGARAPRLAHPPATPRSLPAGDAEVGLWLDAHVNVDAWIDAGKAKTG